MFDLVIVLALFASAGLSYSGINNIERDTIKIDAITGQIRSEKATGSSFSELKAFSHIGEPIVRSYLAICLGSLGKQDKEKFAAESVPILIKLLNDSDQAVRNSAILALKEYGDNAAPATLYLAEIVKRGDPGMDTTWFAADALGSIKSNSAISVPVLVAALSAVDEKVIDGYRYTLRVHAANALCRLEASDEKVLEALESAISTTSNFGSRRSLSAVIDSLMKMNRLHDGKPMPE